MVLIIIKSENCSYTGDLPTKYARMQCKDAKVLARLNMAISLKESLKTLGIGSGIDTQGIIVHNPHQTVGGLHHSRLASFSNKYLPISAILRFDIDR